MIRVGDRWLADFASCNYLGFDLDPEIIQAIRRIELAFDQPVDAPPAIPQSA